MLCSCSKDTQGAQGQQRGGPKVIPVTTAQVKAQAVPLTLSTFGTVEASASIAIKAQVAGILNKVHFQKGQDLKAGQLLFNIDPRQYKANLDQANAALDQANAAHARNKVLLDNANRVADREKKLFDQGTATKDELDQSQTAAAALAAAIKGDQAAIKGGQAAIDKAQLDLENCSITCPIDGKAGDLLVNEGNLVKVSDVNMVTVNQIKPIEMFFSVPQSDMAAVRGHLAKGALKVEAELPDQPGKPETGELFFVDNTVDRNSGTIRLGARFPNADERLWPGQYVMVNLTLAVVKDTLVVPATAVQIGRDGKYVFVVLPDSTADVRPVTTGAQVGDLIVVDKGLKAGETVVTDGQLKLTKGAKVLVRSDKPSGQKASTKPGSGPAASQSAGEPGKSATSPEAKHQVCSDAVRRSSYALTGTLQTILPEAQS